MIKLFRKIRQNLLTENKFSKYLIYAIGEILLVVIGILIALNINNNNELEKNEQYVVSNLKEIQNNLLDDIKESQNVLERYLESDSIQEKVFDFKNPWTIDDFKNKKVTILGNYYDDFVINKNGYENLMRQIDVIPKKYEPILKDLKRLYIALNETINVYNERIRSTVYSNLDFEYTQDWDIYRKKHTQISNEEANYFINDNRYKNYILKYMNDSKNLFNISMRYRAKAIETYEKIDSLLDIKNTELPFHLLGKVNAKEIKEYLGTYQFKKERGGLLKFYVKNNILYSDYSDSESNVTSTFRNYKISDNLYLVGIQVWKFKRDTLGEMGIENMFGTWELTKKK
ncbi:MAG: hypothetical protein ACI93N_001671 [Flavobacteriaceae bacterium]|jgi:hypothetical protein